MLTAPRPRLAAIPVIVLSGVADARREASMLSANGYVDKPLKLPYLLDLLAEYCGSANPASRAKAGHDAQQ